MVFALLECDEGFRGADATATRRVARERLQSLLVDSGALVYATREQVVSDSGTEVVARINAFAGVLLADVGTSLVGDGLVGFAPEPAMSQQTRDLYQFSEDAAKRAGLGMRQP